jgi:hypothetical protein
MYSLMTSFTQHIQRLENKVPRRSEGNVPQEFLEQGIHAMQRRSGGLSSVPDVFAITHLDVIIHRIKRLGNGGYAQVFEGEWQGSPVAVKVLDSKVPQSVSLLSFYPSLPLKCIILCSF